MLDVSADAARDGMKRAAALRPDPFFTKAHAQAIRTGSFDADLDAAAKADWVVEAVVERLDIKQALFARVDAARAPHTIVTSNTSGIPIGALAEGRSDGFRRHFLGTHFFNPPRYLKLLELIPTADTDPAILARDRRRSATAASARASSSPATRRTSSATTSASTRSRASSTSGPRAASPSRTSTR